MRNPIQKRLEHFETWQHLAFMLCLCERMYPNFQLFCQIYGKEQDSKVYSNILNLVWEYLTVKGTKINFESQLEKLEAIIPNIHEYDSYGVFPAADACEALSGVLHTIISGASLEQAISLSKLSLQTVVALLETEQDRTFDTSELKQLEEIQQELDVQWLIYRSLNEAEERDIELLRELKNELRREPISNIGIKIDQ